MIRVLAFLLCICMPALAGAEGRFALVIGNNDYRNVAKLNNAANDAQDIGTALASAGFDVTYGFDLSLSETLEALKTFRAKAAGVDAAVLYYSGHGIEVERRNFMIPSTPNWLLPGTSNSKPCRWTSRCRRSMAPNVSVW